ncbi:hypothetical protein AB0G50_01230, partial [Actinosynnema sp. NPDC020468]
SGAEPAGPAEPSGWSGAEPVVPEQASSWSAARPVESAESSSWAATEPVASAEASAWAAAEPVVPSETPAWAAGEPDVPRAGWSAEVGAGRSWTADFPSPVSDVDTSPIVPAAPEPEPAHGIPAQPASAGFASHSADASFLADVSHSADVSRPADVSYSADVSRFADVSHSVDVTPGGEASRTDHESAPFDGGRVHEAADHRVVPEVEPPGARWPEAELTPFPTPTPFPTMKPVSREVEVPVADSVPQVPEPDPVPVVPEPDQVPDVPEPDQVPFPVEPGGPETPPGGLPVRGSGFLGAADVEDDGEEPFVTSVVVGGRSIELPPIVEPTPVPSASPSATRASRRPKSDLSLAELLAEALVAYEAGRREDEAAASEHERDTAPIVPVGAEETTAPLRRVDTWTLPGT